MTRRSRYGVKRVQHVLADGTVVAFDSKAELLRWLDLTLMQKAGEIRALQRQVRIPIVFEGKPVRYPSGRVLTYVVDFCYLEVGGVPAETPVRVYEDVKMGSGHRPEVYKIKRALVAAMGIEIREVA